MAQLSQRSTIYFDPNMHKALRLKAAQENRSVSDIVNEAVCNMLAEDQKNLMAFEAQDYEPVINYEDLLNGLKSEGKI